MNEIDMKKATFYNKVKEYEATLWSVLAFFYFSCPSVQKKVLVAVVYSVENGSKVHFVTTHIFP
jgi:hypothetical protein